MTSSIDLVNELYGALNVSDVTSVITGAVWKKRPIVKINTGKEDISINALPITGDQLQQAVVNLNIHVPNKNTVIKGVVNNYPDYDRLNQIWKIIEPIVEDFYQNNIGTIIQSQQMIPDDDINETFLNTRLLVHSPNLK